ncbi:glycosyltransferase family 4 protein [Streptomyces sp. HUAS MG91]|uniref:D-inositol 3-phosphate glycosyltransferase n=1 Tax=Streptomyces tabacisoli TaxID=3156398 RepID=A0AAU8IJR1_9ACTN
MKITFLVHNVYAIGGTVRTTLNLAAALADRHSVEIVSMHRHRETPRFAVDPRVTLTPLVDLRPASPDANHPQLAQPAAAFPVQDRRHRQYSRLHDTRTAAHLEQTDADVVIGTRPGLNVYLARYGPAMALRIVQEHLTHDAHDKKLRAVLARHYRQLDAVVTTTRADADVYRARMPLPGVHVTAIPNGVPAVDVPQADGTAPVIAAAGRLTRPKRFDLLIDAFSDIAARHPDWQLKLYGDGAEKARLKQQIDDLGLTGRAHLMGIRTPIETEFAAASLVAVASEAESFGMTIIEAMRCGVPVVSTDCPLGPGEIITDGIDGRLVPVGDREALARALMELIEDPGRRRRISAAARATATAYDPGEIAVAYETLFRGLKETAVLRHRTRRRDRRRRTARGALRRLKSLLNAAAPQRSRR